MSDYEYKINKYEKQIKDYKQIFTKLDEILISDKEKEKGKKSFNSDELIQRVSLLKKVIQNYQKFFDEFNKYLEKPLKTILEIKEAVLKRLKLAAENDKENIFDKLKKNTEKNNKRFKIDFENSKHKFIRKRDKKD